jgi:hypothetical protein
VIGRTSLPATIANGASLSNAVDLLGYDFVALEFPSAWTAASVTFQTSEDGVTFNDVYTYTNTEATMTGAAASRWVVLDSTLVGLFGRYVKIRSGTAAAAVNQAAERTVRVIGRVAV